jgi:hypothetical protein
MLYITHTLYKIIIHILDALRNNHRDVYTEYLT